MAKLNVMDLLSFAKAGYTPKDVKELLSMEVPEPKDLEVITDSPEQKAASENVPKEETQETQPQADAGADDIDYKKLYEETCDKLKKAQELNTQKEASNISSSDDMQAVDDFLRSIM